MWSINVVSIIKNPTITLEHVNQILKSFSDPEYIEFLGDMKKSFDEFDKYPVAKWQREKHDELERLFHENLKVKVDNDTYTISTSFSIEFTQNFDVGNVIDWTEGMNRVVKVRYMSQLKRMLMSNESRDNENAFLDALYDNENVSAEKISDDPNDI